MFPMPRILYAMAEDGILYQVLKRVNARTKTPLIATMISGFIAACMALVFDLHQLIDMMSIGTLLAYTIVAVCVLVLRYQEEYTTYDRCAVGASKPQICKQIFNLNFIKQPNELSSTIANSSIVVFCIFAAILCMLIDTDMEHYTTTNTTIILVTLVCIFIVFLVIARQPQSPIELTFKVPFLPLLPMVSIFLNLYLMFQLDINTWIRFTIWLIIGYLIYFTYGMHSSIEGNREKMELSEHGKKGVDSKRNGTVNARPVIAHTMQSIDNLHNANIDFVNGSTAYLNEK